MTAIVTKAGSWFAGVISSIAGKQDTMTTGTTGLSLLAASNKAAVMTVLSLGVADISGFDTEADSRADGRITTQKGSANGLAPLDSGGKVAAAYLPSTVMEYKGAWNASSNSPSLADGTGDVGDVYRASAAGSRSLGSGSQTWAIGDLVIYNGSIWQHSPAADGVSSVFGRTGAVVATSGDYTTDQVTEGTKKFYADSLAIAAALTGLSTASATVITSSDSIVSALGKLQAQITANKVITTSSLSLSIVGTGATGTQISATKPSSVILNLSESITSSIGGPSTSVITVKVCDTNSATEGDWTTYATFEQDQTITLAVLLNAVQVMKGAVMVNLNPGQYIKVESSGSGTHSEAIVTGQKTIYG